MAPITTGNPTATGREGPAAVRTREKFSPVPISQIAPGNGSTASGEPSSSR